MPQMGKEAWDIKRGHPGRKGQGQDSNSGLLTQRLLLPGSISQTCLQILPNVLWVAKSPPVENHCTRWRANISEACAMRQMLYWCDLQFDLHNNPVRCFTMCKWRDRGREVKNTQLRSSRAGLWSRSDWFPCSQEPEITIKTRSIKAFVGVLQLFI